MGSTEWKAYVRAHALPFHQKFLVPLRVRKRLQSLKTLCIIDVNIQEQLFQCTSDHWCELSIYVFAWLKEMPGIWCFGFGLFGFIFAFIKPVTHITVYSWEYLCLHMLPLACLQTLKNLVWTIRSPNVCLHVCVHIIWEAVSRSCIPVSCAPVKPFVWRIVCLAQWFSTGGLQVCF